MSVIANNRADYLPHRSPMGNIVCSRTDEILERAGHLMVGSAFVVGSAMIAYLAFTIGVPHTSRALVLQIVNLSIVTMGPLGGFVFLRYAFCGHKPRQPSSEASRAASFSLPDQKKCVPIEEADLDPTAPPAEDATVARHLIAVTDSELALINLIRQVGILRSP